MPDRLYRLRRHAEDYLRACLETSDYVLAEKLEKEREASPYHTSGSIDCRVPLVRVYQERGNTEQLRILAKGFLLNDRLFYYPILKKATTKKNGKLLVMACLMSYRPVLEQSMLCSIDKTLILRSSRLKVSRSDCSPMSERTLF